jgi:hypothetical protein
MRRLSLLLIFSAVAFLALPLSAHATTHSSPLSPAEVVVLNPSMDGSTIVVEGEAVGDILRAVGGGKWLNVLGGDVGLGVWTTEEMLEPVEHLGSYKRDGDQVRVTGTLNMTCEQHGGEYDLHAESIEVVSAGRPRTHEPVPMRGVVGVVGIVIGAGLLRRYQKLRD